MEIPQRLLDSMAEKGWAYSDEILDPLDLQRLQQLARHRLTTDSFRPAQVASGRAPKIRSDSLLWLDPSHPQESWIFNILEAWRQNLTQFYFVSAPEIEAHMTHYSPGQFYDLHCDQPQGQETRIFTFIVYLHDEWQSHFGGELSIYSGPQGHEVERIEPRPGRVVFFKSREIWHQVRETHFHRISLTGWFRHP